MRFSDILKPYEGVLNAEVNQAINEIKQYFKVDDLKVLDYDTFSVVVVAEYQVSLPSRGSVNGLIEPVEPILIKLPLFDYPDRAPMILSDRMDFPKTHLSHRYYTAPDKPAALCLVRANLNEWFASVRIADLLLVGAQWFYKAATGTLNEDGDEFDPIMLEKYRGNHIYKYDLLNEVVEKDQRFLPEFPMAVMLSCQYTNMPEAEDEMIYKTINSVPVLLYEQFKSSLYEFYKQYNTDDAAAEPMFSLLVWDPDHTEESTYCTALPTNFGQLKTYLIMRGISIETLLGVVEKAGILIKRGLPIIHAIKRPKKVIGYNSTYEFFNFVLLMPEDGVKALTNDCVVKFQKHIEPFSQNLARALSGETRLESTIFVGAGSLGSKMVFHDARTGKLNIGVSDHDLLLQHNLARHALFQDSIGKNKANATIETIKSLYSLDTIRNFVAYDSRISMLDEEVLTQYRSLVDTTASLQVLHHLTLRDLPQEMRYTRCEIADDGELGLLYTEGNHRNPRMDDLVKLTSYYATVDNDLQQWRRNDAKREITTVNIGLGCSSTTTIMPDDLISSHAAAFSRILANNSGQQLSGGKGLICLNVHREHKGMPEIISRSYTVKPFEILYCLNNSGWSLRLLAGTTQKLFDLCAEHAPTETGGILVGVANYKTRVIHVFDIITEPQDSQGTCTGFTRGTKGLPEIINKVKEQTGEVIGYIGEWHTHPMDLKRLSSRDLQTIHELKVINAKTPIPTCAVIVTPNQILPYVFE